MAVMVTAHLLTRADLDALPDDGLRHELIDGQIVMTPSPGTTHQTLSLRLASLLDQAVRGTHLKAMAAPYDVVLGPHVVGPDVVIGRRADFTDKDLPVAPVLVVEILSPNTRHLDRGRKRELYAEVGVAHYWIIDPDGPAITTYELRDGAYQQTADATGDETLTVTAPVALTLTPAELLND